MRNMKKSISTLIFCILFLILFFYISNILEKKDGQNEYAPFFSEQEDYDVLLFGSSVMTSGISPLDLWNDYGICSWNLANNGQTLALNYFCMKNALHTQKPKLCVVDLTYLPKKDLTNGEGRLHEFLDSMPMSSRERIEVLRELVPYEDWGNYLLPITYYHGRWTELSEKDFHIPQSYNRGGTIMKQSVKDGVVFDTSSFSDGLELIPENETAAIPDTNAEYCRKMIELCAENGIDILFIHFPHYISDEYYNGNAARVQAQYNGFSHVISGFENATYKNYNYELEEIGFSFVDHMRDNTHLNILGNRKMTEVLGKYILEHYDIPDRRNDESLKKWEEDWKIWNQYRNEMLEESGS